MKKIPWSLAGCTLCLLLSALPARSAPSFLVEPYLQDPTPHGMTVMWETTDGENRLEYWREGEPPATVAAARVTGRNIYFATLEGLSSNTAYHYKVVTSGGEAPTYELRTWPTKEDGVAGTKVIAFSDSQGDWPERLQDICENGIIAKECAGGTAASCVDDLAGILVAGDLVSDGDNFDQWREEFFRPCRNLFHYVPVLPAIGNHDLLVPNYLAYFSLPANGTTWNNERWYAESLLNLRLITLDSTSYTTTQWDWFQGVLDEACADPDVDFVVTQLHYPCKSELWPQGEDLQSCFFVSMMEDFSRTCGKPSAHLFGHTHGYSRGQSRDMTHIWMNVAPSGGDIDYWGEYDQKDYDEFQISNDEYGFVTLHLTRGAGASLRMVRRTGGDGVNYYGYTDETIRDDFSIELSNHAPDAPAPVYPVDVYVPGELVTLEASPFSDVDGDFHHSSHWQMRTAVGTYDRPVVDAWGNTTRFQNLWGDEDTQAGQDITTFTVGIEPNKTYFWRVRYRDQHFGWSDWSAEASFSTSPNLPCGAVAGTEAGRQGGVADGLTSGPTSLLVPLLFVAATFVRKGRNRGWRGRCAPRHPPRLERPASTGR